MSKSAEQTFILLRLKEIPGNFVSHSYLGEIIAMSDKAITLKKPCHVFEYFVDVTGPDGKPKGSVMNSLIFADDAITEDQLTVDMSSVQASRPLKLEHELCKTYLKVLVDYRAKKAGLIVGPEGANPHLSVASSNEEPTPRTNAPESKVVQ